MLDEHEDAERRHASGWNASARMMIPTAISSATTVHAQEQEAGIGARKRGPEATVPMLIAPLRGNL